MQVSAGPIKQWANWIFFYFWLKLKKKLDVSKWTIYVCFKIDMLDWKDFYSLTTDLGKKPLQDQLDQKKMAEGEDHSKMLNNSYFLPK